MSVRLCVSTGTNVTGVFTTRHSIFTTGTNVTGVPLLGNALSNFLDLHCLHIYGVSPVIIDRVPSSKDRVPSSKDAYLRC
jgi:hypothetical protein